MITDTTKDAISRIKEAEEKAKSATKKAEDHAQKAILDAKLDAEEIIFWAEVDAIAKSHGILRNAKSVIEAEFEKIAKNTQKEKQEIEKKATANLPKATEFILAQLLKHYGNSKT